MRTIRRNDYVITIPKASLQEANEILRRNGYGPDNFRVAVIADSVKDIILENENFDDEYICSAPLSELYFRVFSNLLKNHAVVLDQETIEQYKTRRNVKTGDQRFDFGCAILIIAANRTAVINRMTNRYPNANTKFFLIGLSTTGVAPAQAYADRFKLDRSYGDEIKFLAENVPRSEIFLWPLRNSNVLQALNDNFNLPKYQDPNRNTRTFARIRVSQEPPTPQSILTEFNLKVIS